MPADVHRGHGKRIVMRTTPVDARQDSPAGQARKLAELEYSPSRQYAPIGLLRLAATPAVLTASFTEVKVSRKLK